MSYIITADSGCDLPLEVLEKNNVIPLFMNYYIEGDEHTDTMIDADIVDFYNIERTGIVPTTSQISPTKYVEFWKELIKEGNEEIVHISMSSGISGTYNNGVNAAEMINEIYPDVKIYVIDSLFASTGEGMLVLEAVRMRNQGKTAKECAEWIEKNKLCINSLITTGNLNYLHKGGRVSKTSAIFGTALKINPVIRLNKAGELKVTDKIRGEKAVLEMIVKEVEATVISPEKQTLYISHADNIEKAKQYGAAIMEKVPFRDVKYYYIGTTIGSHTGFGLIATFFFGKQRTDIKKEI